MPSLSQTAIKNELCRYSLPLELLSAEGLLAGSHTMHFALKMFPLLLLQCSVGFAAVSCQAVNRAQLFLIVILGHVGICSKNLIFFWTGGEVWSLSENRDGSVK